MGAGVASEAGDGVRRRRALVDKEASGAEVLGMEAEDAGGAETPEYSAVADVVEEAALFNAAVDDGRRGGDDGFFFCRLD